MSKRPLVPSAEGELDKMKEEISDEMHIDRKSKRQVPYGGDLKSSQAGMMGKMKNAGNVGGEMVKRMIKKTEDEMAEEMDAKDQWKK